jgi:hypothetical protein
MNDSDIPVFTTKVLQACKQTSKAGRWARPKVSGEFNYKCCPLQVCNALGIKLILNWHETVGFARGYDGRPMEDADERFYTLGQGFRKIAETVGF